MAVGDADAKQAWLAKLDVPATGSAAWGYEKPAGGVVKSTAAQLGHQIQPFWKSAIINGCGYNTTESIFGSFQIFATFEMYDRGFAVGGGPEIFRGWKPRRVV